MGTVIIKANGYNVNINSAVKPSKYTTLSLDGFKFNNICFAVDWSLLLTNCVLTNCKAESMFVNKGSAALINCSVINNNCKYLFNNEGIMSLVNSSLTNNIATKYGLIYNNGGVFTSINSTIYSKDIIAIYNFQTANCAVIGGTVGQTIFDQPMAAWKLDAIKAGILAGTALVSGAAGYAIGATLGSCGLAFALSVVAGVAIGVAGGLIYGAIESATFHDYSHLWTNVATFAGIGFTFSVIGFAWGLDRYKASHQPIDIDMNYEHLQLIEENPNTPKTSNTNTKVWSDQEIYKLIDENPGLKKAYNELDRAVSRRDLNEIDEAISHLKKECNDGAWMRSPNGAGMMAGEDDGLAKAIGDRIYDKYAAMWKLGPYDNRQLSYRAWKASITKSEMQKMDALGEIKRTIW